MLWPGGRDIVVQREQLWRIEASSVVASFISLRGREEPALFSLLNSFCFLQNLSNFEHATFNHILKFEVLFRIPHHILASTVKRPLPHCFQLLVALLFQLFDFAATFSIACVEFFVNKVALSATMVRYKKFSLV